MHHECYNDIAHWVRVNAGGIVSKLNTKQEVFCQEYALNGGNATEAWRKAHPDSKAKVETQHAQASKMLGKHEVRIRIAALQEAAKEKANQKFSITVEQRLKWLKEITEAGLGVYSDQGGNERRENLAAARAAIATMNDMLGTGNEEVGNKPIEIRIVDATSRE